VAAVVWEKIGARDVLLDQRKSFDYFARMSARPFIIMPGKFGERELRVRLGQPPHHRNGRFRVVTSRSRQRANRLLRCRVSDAGPIPTERTAVGPAFESLSRRKPRDGRASFAARLAMGI
jgi:hypothetical protein